MKKPLSLKDKLFVVVMMIKDKPIITEITTSIKCVLAHEKNLIHFENLIVYIGESYCPSGVGILPPFKKMSFLEFKGLVNG